MNLPQDLDAKLRQGLESDVDLNSLTARLEKAASVNRRLVVKLGVDPTSAELHLGHVTVLKKLRFFQDLGHQAVLVIGDFTAMIGDPSGVNKTRPVLTRNQITHNMANYARQAGLILDLKSAKIVYNSSWYSGSSLFGKGMKLEDFIPYAMQISVNNLIERKDFQNRLKAGESVALHELMYPVIMAIDSVQLKADIEIGGYDQRLNLLLGRELQKKVGQHPQEIVMTKLLLGTDGNRKMSSSYDNYIAVTEKPSEMFGQLMSVPDNQTTTYSELLLDYQQWQAVVTSKLSPRDKKALMAQSVVASLHGVSAARVAQQQFESIFRDKKVDPELIAQLPVTSGSMLVDIITQAVPCSRSQASRLLQQKAVKLNETIMTNLNFIPDLDQEQILQVGKRGFYRLIKR